MLKKEILIEARPTTAGVDLGVAKMRIFSFLVALALPDVHIDVEFGRVVL